MIIKRCHLWAEIEGMMKAIVTGRSICDMSRRFWHKREDHDLKDEYPLFVQVEREDGRRSLNVTDIQLDMIRSMTYGGYQDWIGQIAFSFPPRYRLVFPEHDVTIAITKTRARNYMKRRKDILLNWNPRWTTPSEVHLEKERDLGWEVVDEAPPPHIFVGDPPQ